MNIVCLQVFLLKFVYLLKIDMDHIINWIVRNLWFIVLIILGLIILLKLDTIISIISMIKNRSKKVEKVKTSPVSVKKGKTKKTDLIIDVDYKVKKK